LFTGTRYLVPGYRYLVSVEQVALDLKLCASIPAIFLRSKDLLGSTPTLLTVLYGLAWWARNTGLFALYKQLTGMPPS
jgi:hypothetical protein